MASRWRYDAIVLRFSALRIARTVPSGCPSSARVTHEPAALCADRGPDAEFLTGIEYAMRILRVTSGLTIRMPAS